MLYYAIPNKIYIFKSSNFKLILEDKPLYLSASICEKLHNHKEKIDDYSERWDVVKKYVNPYEYIHTPVCI